MFKVDNPGLRMLPGFPLVQWLLLGNALIYMFALVIALAFFFPVKAQYAEVLQQREESQRRYNQLRANEQFLQQVLEYSEQISENYEKAVLPYQGVSALEGIGSRVVDQGLILRKEKYGNLKYREDGVWELSGRLGMTGDYSSFAQFVRSLKSLDNMALIDTVEIKSRKGEMLSISADVLLYGKNQ